MTQLDPRVSSAPAFNPKLPTKKVAGSGGTPAFDPKLPTVKFTPPADPGSINGFSPSGDGNVENIMGEKRPMNMIEQAEFGKAPPPVSTDWLEGSPPISLVDMAGRYSNAASFGLLGDEALAGIHGTVAAMTGGSFDDAYNRKFNDLGRDQDRLSTFYPTEAAATDVGGAILNPGNFLGSRFLSGGAGLLNNSVRGAMVGGPTAAVTGFMNDRGDFNSRVDAGLDAGGKGAALGAGLNVLGSVISPNIRPEITDVIKRGVTPTPGQIMGGVPGFIERQATSIPITGTFINRALLRARDQANKAVYNEVLAPIGESYKGAAVGNEAIDEVSSAISSHYDDILKDPALKFRADPKLLADISKITNDAKLLPVQTQNNLNKLITDGITPRFSPRGGKLTGTQFKELDSQLGMQARNMSGDPSADARALGDIYGKIQKAFRAALSRSNPAHAGELAKVNAAFSRLVPLQSAANAVATSEGKFTTGAYLRAIRNGDKSARRSAFARGKAKGQPLATTLEKAVGGNVPDSGTAGRRALFDIATLAAGGVGAVISPVVMKGLLAMGAASIPYTKAGGILAKHLLTSRPKGAAAVRGLLTSQIPAIGSIAGQDQ